MPQMSLSEVAGAIRDNAGVAGDFDVEVLSLADAGAEVRLPVDERMLRLGGTVSGPVLMTLVDTAMYAAVLGHVERGAYGVTSHLSIEFLRRPPPEALRARADILRRGRRQVTATVAITSEAESRLVVHATGAYALFDR